MKQSFLVFGAGAIGTYMGVSLALQGHQIVFLEKEHAVPILKEQGLHMSLGEEDYQLTEAEFLSGFDVLQSKKFDLGILALKTYHLDVILPKLSEYKRYLPPLLCLQNGVDSEKKLADTLGSNIIIPGTVTSAVDRLDKGRVVVQKSRGMVIAGDHPQLKDFQAVFNQAGLNCRVYRQPETMKWSKLIINLLGNASSAILNLPPSAIYAHPDLYRMELEQIREALNVMRKQQIPAVNLPGVPVKALAVAVRSLPASISQPLLSGLIGGGRGEKMPSFHIDLHSGKGNCEVSDLNGAVVRTGEKVGVATPVNHFLTSILMGLITGDIPLDKYQNQPGLFLKDLNSSKADRSFSG
jgi:2-dehydropantoate 2-reductase